MSGSSVQEDQQVRNEINHLAGVSLQMSGDRRQAAWFCRHASVTHGQAEVCLSLLTPPDICRRGRGQFLIITFVSQGTGTTLSNLLFRPCRWGGTVFQPAFARDSYTPWEADISFTVHPPLATGSQFWAASQHIRNPPKQIRLLLHSRLTSAATTNSLLLGFVYTHKERTQL